MILYRWKLNLQQDYAIPGFAIQQEIVWTGLSRRR